VEIYLRELKKKISLFYHPYYCMMEKEIRGTAKVRVDKPSLLWRAAPN
jgi:hypothetical protein